MKMFRFEYWIPSQTMQAQYHTAVSDSEALDIAENLVAAVGAVSCDVFSHDGVQRAWVGYVLHDGSRKSA